ncbi:Uncharacterised protein [Halioglobus japonicus]|nr:Uncharacterised protein [Halioglobus japonicus]
MTTAQLKNARDPETGDAAGFNTGSRSSVSRSALHSQGLKMKKHRFVSALPMSARRFAAAVFCMATMASQAQASFTDVTTTVLPMPTMSNGQPPNLDGGATTGDFDNDGDIDIIMPTREDRDLYFRNNGDGTFSEIGEQVGFTFVTDGRSAAAGDIDNDGDLDVYVTAHIELGHYLYINDGNGVFTEEAGLRGASIPGGFRFGRGVAFGDYDQDGYLDIFVAEYVEPWMDVLETTGPISRLLRNRGALQPGYYDDVTITAGVVQNGIPGYRAGVYPHTPRFTDLDRDGWPDLVIASDYDESRLYWNNGDGTFTDGTAGSGFATGRTEMGMDTADINGDGLLDIVTTSIFLDQDDNGVPDNHWDGNRLYLNNGDRTFTDGTEVAGIRKGYWGWGVVAFDFDNDSDLDLFQANGFEDCASCAEEFPNVNWVGAFLDEPTLLFENDGNAIFTEVAVANGIVNSEVSIGVIAFDYDSDGDQDVLQINRGVAPNLFRNDTVNDSDWLQIKLDSSASAANGIGAYVTVTPSTGGVSQVKEVSASGTWMAQDGSGILHFGLGDLADGSTVDVQIDWPTGVQTFHAAQLVNHRVTYADALPGTLSLVADKPSPSGIEELGAITFTASADGGVGQYEYQFWAQAPAGDWQLIQDYSNSNTFSYTPSVVGEFAIMVRARNKGSSAEYEVEQNLGFIVTQDPPLNSVALTVDRPDPMYLNNGSTATITATTSGDSGSPEFQFWLRDPAGQWAMVQDWGPSETLDVIPDMAGSYTVVSRARNVGSLTDFEAETAVVFDVLPVAPVLAVGLTSDKPTPALLDTLGEVAIIASANGGSGSYEYQFMVTTPEGFNVVAQEYGSSSTYVSTPPNPGRYIITVAVRNNGSTAPYEAINAMIFDVLDAPANNEIVITADKQSPAQLQGIGGVNFTATVGGHDSDIEYQFFSRTNAGAWQLVQDYSESSSYAATPASVGNIDVVAYARAAGSAEPLGAPGFFSFELLDSPTAQTVGVSSGKSGAIVLQDPNLPMFTAQATGGSGDYEYMFQVNSVDGTPIFSQAYGATAILDWQPEASGLYSISAFVRNAGSASAFEALGATLIEVLDLPPIAGLSLAADKPSPGSFESTGTVTYTASATGGSSNIEYQFWVRSPAGDWSLGQDYSGSSSFAHTPTVAGDFVIVAYARNIGSTATFDVNTLTLFTLDEPLQPADLLVVHGDGDGSYTPGTEVTLTADPADAHYYFSHWSSTDGSIINDINAAQTTLLMPETAAVVTANYLPGVSPDADVDVARRWNEVLVQAIRKDFARPTIHARNLFHASAAMYDAWAAFADVEETWLLGRSRAGVDCPLINITPPVDVEEARREAISHAVYRLMRHRFVSSPGVWTTIRDADALMGYLGYDSNDDTAGSPAALGNHIAQCYIDFGLADGANEANEYRNQSYQPLNAVLQPELPGNPNITDLNRWQPLSLLESIDQSGNPVSTTPAFLGPEWGRVVPFALQADDRVVYERNGFDYWLYHDPGMPPTIDGTLTDVYKWTFSLVSIWSAHLDPGDGVMMDISPASIGNIQSYPTQFEDYDQFYNTLDGGDASVGYQVNPVTGQAYTPQIVPRGDYARVLAEFWADGPESETPPGHWFVILNEVSDHPLSTRRFAGAGPELDQLEWEVKSYFTLGGGMHDAAVTAWGLKGWYDYIRPISSLRAMADLGQSSNPELPSYHANGIPLEPGYVELVGEGDALAGPAGEHVGKIKVMAWRGPDYIVNPATDEAGVDWILAENWWPYQRPSFVTPPFAGYVSGHSTFSRAAAEIMTALTGDAYFPGGMSGFEVEANEFLVFEEGPSVGMTLQWATYRDASDQCSLSRIWGGIHPPVDDIPGRLMGIEIGVDAFNLAADMFNGTAPP